MSLGALAFLNPWLLAAIASLPVIYWLLRTVPPRPRQIVFPPARILAGLENREKTPAKTPWWLLLIRLLAAALVIFALAEPVLNPSREAAIGGDGPVLLVVDNGWTAAPRWSERMSMLDGLIAEAEAQNRPVIVLATAAAATTPTARVESPADARATAAALAPQPYAPDRLAAISALETALGQGARGTIGAVWLADGVDHGGRAREFLDRLGKIAAAGTAVVEPPPGAEPLGAVAGLGGSGRLDATVIRPSGPAREAVLHAVSAQGQRLGEAVARFAPGETAAKASFDLPLELRNQVTRVEIAGERSAGAAGLLDARSQWRRVGLLSGENREQAQPLLGPLYYIERALAPFADLVEPKDSNVTAGVKAILEQNPSALVLADIGTLHGEAEQHIADWVAKGGVLVRFAGVRLEKGGDDLLPAPLRIGGRTLGGALSWSTPRPLAAFEETSPFAGLDVPADVTVGRQVLSDPARMGAETEVWARLDDGTPLVTAGARGRGRVVLFHVTANSDWSSLPMSGLFVEMLRRVIALGSAEPGGTAAAANTLEAAPRGAREAEVLAPIQVLDGFGVLGPPPPSARPVAAAKFDGLAPSLDHPPGYYGTSGRPRALNAVSAKTTLLPLPPPPAGVARRGYDGEAAVPLKPWLLAGAFTLILADIVAVLFLQMGGLGLGRGWIRRAAAAVAIVFAGGALLSGGKAFAEARVEPRAASPPETGLDAAARAATSKVTFGYVVTGDSAADETSRLGLMGLDKILSLRTAVEPGDPMGVDIEKDEIAFFPVLYWPVLPNVLALPETTVAKIDAYMKQGGMIVFDTRDYGQGLPSGVAQPGEDSTPLQRLLGQLDLPRLEPVPEHHVLTKSFYLLRYFPGRWDGGQLWVEAGEDGGDGEEQEDRKPRKADGVTSIIVTSNDFAAAWALDERGRPIYPVAPGGETQREMAFRTGVNIVMHALTGNYKADQVHVPALLERLGQ